MKSKTAVLLLFLTVCLLAEAGGKEERFRVMEYNVENLFDIENDSLTQDEEFTPDGDHHWTYYRYRTKLNNIAKTIIALGEGQAPALVGLCEIENRQVLEDLTQKTPIVKYGYKIVHQESPDRRGVDVGLLYQPDLFRLLSVDFLNVKNENVKATRDILFAKGVVPTGDTLHVFLNHWPSRRDGELVTEKNRCYAASIVRDKVDSIFHATDTPYILIMGDFNDYPDNKSITEVLVANPVPEQMCCPRELYNLFYLYQKSGMFGTYKFQGEWNVLDQMIVSGVFMKNDRFYTGGNANAHIFNPSFLCTDGVTGTDGAPYRTYVGPTYKGGFSDHFPIYVDFYLRR